MEALRLRVKDVDLQARTLTIRRPKWKRDRITVLPPGGGRHARRGDRRRSDRIAEARLTTQSWDSQRHTLLPFVLDLPPNRSLTSAQQTAVFVFAESVAGQSEELEKLVGPLSEIGALISGELER